jgi:hypothetical protein
MTIVTRLGLAFFGTALLAACGGGGGIPAVTKPAAGTAATSTALVQIEVPLHVAAASAHTRSPQWVSPSTTFFLVDLQNNSDPRFDNTFTVDATHCQSATNAGLPVLACSFTATIPAGDPTTQRWSIAAGAGKTDGSTGPPLSVVHNTPAQLANGQAQILAFLDTIVSSVTVSSLGLGNFQPSGTVKYVPYFTITALDAFGNASVGDETTNPGVEQFANPITLTEDDASGVLGLGIIFHAVGPSPYQPPNPTLVSTTTFTRLNQLAAIEIVDNVTTSGTMNVSYSLPAIALQPSEFPQLHTTWGSAATTVKVASYRCGPLTNSATVNPCTQTFP